MYLRYSFDSKLVNYSQITENKILNKNFNIDLINFNKKIENFPKFLPGDKLILKKNQKNLIFIGKTNDSKLILIDEINKKLYFKYFNEILY